MELKEVHYVYALLDALDIEVYIGKTCNPRSRLSTHHSCPSGLPMRAAIDHGCRFRMRILSEHPSHQEAIAEEKRQIAQRLAEGCYLLNVAQNYPANPAGVYHDTPTRQWWMKRREEAGWPQNIWD